MGKEHRETDRDQEALVRAERGAGAGLPVSAGIRARRAAGDSFHSLLRGPKVDALVHVHGFDAPPADAERLARFEPDFRRIARIVGCRAVLIRTNLREHPRFCRADWQSTHGGALGGVAHLLESSFGSAAISSSDTGVFNAPWGSHQDTDPLYSSEELSIQHCDENIHRLEKHRAIAAEPLVREHLWVCWKGRGSPLNCGHCEKCVRTMVFLLGLGELERSRVFDCPAEDLAARIDLLAPVKNPYTKTYWADVLEELELPMELQVAARRLLLRSNWDPVQVKRSRAVVPRGGQVDSVIDVAREHAHGILVSSPNDGDRNEESKGPGA
jgi:hypothetical protein